MKDKIEELKEQIRQEEIRRIMLYTGANYVQAIEHRQLIKEKEQLKNAFWTLLEYAFTIAFIFSIIYIIL